MQYEELMLTHGFQSSGDTKLHFGLDTIKTVDSILIVWSNQKCQVIKNVPSNKPLIAEQKNAADLFQLQPFFSLQKQTNIGRYYSTGINSNWKHKENNFTDFNVQYLIPHKESTRGPKIAVGDINNDGLDDFYACGAAYNAGAMMVQQKDGTFKATDTAMFNHDAPYEDMDAVIFDANGDGFKDLLVISGGGEPQGNSPMLLEDRLYLNDGKGGFIKKTDFLITEAIQ